MEIQEEGMVSRVSDESVIKQLNEIEESDKELSCGRETGGGTESNDYS